MNNNFRIWDTKHEQYLIKNHVFKNTFYSEKSDFAKYKSLDDIFFNPRYIVQLGSDVIDKNGFEIYESDTVYAHLNERNYKVCFGKYNYIDHDTYQTHHCGFYLLDLQDGCMENMGADSNNFLTIISNNHNLALE